jgi:P-type E1-E2 ATPase
VDHRDLRKFRRIAGGESRQSAGRCLAEIPLANEREQAHEQRQLQNVPSETLRKDDVVRVSAGELIPSDGEVIEGAAMVNESAITGESAPVVRESGGDRSSVTGGTVVLVRYNSGARLS